MRWLENGDTGEKAELGDGKLKTIAAKSDELDDNEEIEEIIAHLVDRRYNQLIGSGSADSDSVEEAQADLANRFFGEKSGYDKHSAAGSTEKIRGSNEVEEEELSAEEQSVSEKQAELSERFF